MSAQPTHSKRKRKPTMITSEDGDIWVLATDEAQALDFAQRAYPLDPLHVEDEGWMINEGWDRENYERKRDFVEETGYTSWWTGCRAPTDGQETARLRRVWSVHFDWPDDA